MCAMHVHPRDQAEEVKTREVADTSLRIASNI